MLSKEEAGRLHSLVFSSGNLPFAATGEAWRAAFPPQDRVRACTAAVALLEVGGGGHARTAAVAVLEVATRLLPSSAGTPCCVPVRPCC